MLYRFFFTFHLFTFWFQRAEGLHVRITCSGKNPSWYKDNQPIDEELVPLDQVPMHGVDLTEPNELYINDAEFIHTGSYVCVSQDENNNMQTGESKLYIGENKDLENNIIFPKTLKAPVGTVKSFHCNLDQMEWFYEQKELPRYTLVARHQKTLSFMTVKMEHFGYYYCYGLDSSKNPIVVAGRLLLKDQSRMRPSHVLATLGDAAKFECFSSMPFLTYWRFNDGSLPSDVNTNINTLSIPRVSWKHEGVYECYGSAILQRQMRFVAVGKLEVTDKSYFRRSCTYLWSAMFGESTSYTCKSDKKLNWVWNFNGKYLPPNAHQQTTPPGNSSSVIIVKTTPQNAGTYQCQGYNESGLVDTQECQLEVERLHPIAEAKNEKVRNSLAYMRGRPSNCPIVELPYGTVQYQGLSAGDSAVLKCREGFKMKGLLVRKCQENGEWSGLSECQRIADKAWDSQTQQTSLMCIIVLIVFF